MNAVRGIVSAVWRGANRVPARISAWANRAFDRLSAVQPLYFLVLYMLCVPLFAWAYMSMPGSFYAPYAKSEPSAVGDARAIVRVIETAVHQHLQSLEERRLKFPSKSPDTEWRVLPHRLFATRWDITENSIKLVFGIGMSEGAEEKLVANLPVTIRSFRTVREEGFNDVLVHIDYDQRAVTAEPLSAYLQKHHVFAGMPIAFLSGPDRNLIANYLEGYAGDPTRISDSYWRMLYFSVVVITTVGFGDIVPMTAGARALVAVEAIAGALLVGLFLNSIAGRRGSS